jgi:uncharacterized repeat protein (TIGR03803 family)
MSESLLYSFAGTSGIYPQASVIYESGILYGVTSSGGSGLSYGTLFSYNVSSNTLATLHSFTFPPFTNGKQPQASVIYESGILYGTTTAGGTSNKGTLFKYDLSTSTLSNVHIFTGQPTDGSQPQNSVIYESGILYGTTFNGGTDDKGTLFSYNLTSNTLTILYSFAGQPTEGSYPEAGVIYQSGILYGTTSTGGSSNLGTLFSYNLTSNTLTTLYSFTGIGTDGSYSKADVIYQSGILYGTTYSGGSSNLGTLFSYDLTSSTLTTLHSFTGIGTDGKNPLASVIYQGGILYGTTSTGGSSNLGTLFSYNLASNTLTTFYSFTGQPTDGSQPYAGVIYQNGILYGTTYSGGSGNQGSLFSYTITPTPTPVPISNICFPAGTLISTDQGEISIEKIIPFENTINNKNIKAITKTISHDTYLVCFDKNALGNNYPNKKTIISKEHKILYKGKMIEAYKFLGHFEKVQKVNYNQEILYNVLMEKYEKIKVNNIMCETLHPNNIIAKLYNSNYDEEYKNKIIYIMNESINKNDKNSYIKMMKRITN